MRFGVHWPTHSQSGCSRRGVPIRVENGTAVLMPTALTDDPGVESELKGYSCETNLNCWVDEYRGPMCRELRRSTVSQRLVACRHEATDLRGRRVFDPRNHLSRQGEAGRSRGFRDLRGG